MKNAIKKALSIVLALLVFVSLVSVSAESDTLEVTYSYKDAQGNAVTENIIVPVYPEMPYSEIAEDLEELLPEGDTGIGWKFSPGTVYDKYTSEEEYYIELMRDYEGYTEAYANIVFVDKEEDYCGYDTPFYIEGEITDDDEIAAILEEKVTAYMAEADLSDTLTLVEFAANGTFGGENTSLDLAEGHNICAVYTEAIVKFVYPDLSYSVDTVAPGEVIEFEETYNGKEIVWDAQYEDDGKVYAQAPHNQFSATYADGSITVKFYFSYINSDGEIVDAEEVTILPGGDELDGYMTYFFGEILPGLSLSEEDEIVGWTASDEYFEGDNYLVIYVYPDYDNGEEGGEEEGDVEESYPEPGYVGVEYEYVNKDGKVVIDHTEVYVDGSDELAYVVGPVVSELDHYSEPISYRLWVYCEDEVDEPVELDVTDPEIMLEIIDGYYDGWLFIAQVLYEDIDVCDHRMEYVEGVASTPETVGYKQYFECVDCGLKYYFDNDGYRVTFENLSEIEVKYMGVIQKEEGKVEVNVSDDAIYEAVNDAVLNEEESKITVTLDVTKATDKTVTDVTISQNVIEELVEATSEVEEDIELVVELSEVTVVIDMEALAATTEVEGAKTLSVNVEKETKQLTEKQTEAVKDVEVLLTVSAQWVNEEGEKISDFKGGEITIQLNDFKPEEGKKVEDYAVVYISDNGKIEIMPVFVKDGILCFTTDHFSDFAVMTKADAKALTEVTNPKTIDATPVVFFIALMAVAAVSLILVQKKRHN